MEYKRITLISLIISYQYEESVLFKYAVYNKNKIFQMYKNIDYHVRTNLFIFTWLLLQSRALIECKQFCSLSRFLQVFHANNSSFHIKAGTSNSHAADLQLLYMQFSCGWSTSITAIPFCMRLSNSFTAKRNLEFMKVHEMELLQLISVNAVNDMESRV